MEHTAYSGHVTSSTGPFSQFNLLGFFSLLLLHLVSLELFQIIGISRISSMRI